MAPQPVERVLRAAWRPELVERARQRLDRRLRLGCGHRFGLPLLGIGSRVYLLDHRLTDFPTRGNARHRSRLSKRAVSEHD